MKSVLRLIVFGIAILPFAGCYTELATREENDREYAYDADTISENGNTTINNHYYLDDNYRRSRLSVSFQYYYPSYSSWISSYYHSYFNDYYWGMYHRPSWYYDPLLTYYPPYGWPYPYYDPWYPYYPPIAYYPVYYPVYYPSPVYTNNPVSPGRPRPGGSTRDPLPDDIRPRPNTPVGTMIPIAEKPSDENRPIERPRPIRDNDKPRWDKLPVERPVRNPNDDARPVDIGKDTKPPRENPPVYPKPTDKPDKDGDARPVDRPKNNHPVYSPPKRDDRPVERPKNNTPVYTPPAKKPSGNDEARPVERPRETRQPSYNPPPQSSPPPQSTPPRSSGGGSSSGGNGRKRD